MQYFDFRRGQHQVLPPGPWVDALGEIGHRGPCLSTTCRPQVGGNLAWSRTIFDRRRPREHLTCGGSDGGRAEVELRDEGKTLAIDRMASAFEDASPHCKLLGASQTRNIQREARAPQVDLASSRRNDQCPARRFEETPDRATADSIARVDVVAVNHQHTRHQRGFPRPQATQRVNVSR